MASLRRPVRPLRIAVFALLLTIAPSTLPAHAAGVVEASVDDVVLTTLEHQAEAAQPKDRCYLYSELLHGWTELAGRHMASGNDVEAARALAHADADMIQLKAALARDSKRLINAEQLLEHSAHRLTDMVRVATFDQHDAMQAVLKHLNNVHDALLAQIFAH